MIKAFTVESWKKTLALLPNEDSYKISSNGVLCVADGVTRDPCETLPDLDTLAGKLSLSLKYPRPSPAAVAAEIFTETFVLVLGDYLKNNRNEKAIRVAFEYANRKIQDWNQENMHMSDYLKKDLAGCVASGVTLEKDSICLGFIADSGVAIFDFNGNLRFRTEDQGPSKYDKVFWQDPRIKGLDWKHPKTRRIIRRDYRNNPENPNSFGVLTGKEAAMSYVRTATQELRLGDCVVVYTGGLEPVIFSGEFADALRQDDLKKMKSLCKQGVKTQASLVYYSK